MTILIVDDLPANVRLLRAQLEQVEKNNKILYVRSVVLRVLIP